MTSPSATASKCGFRCVGSFRLRPTRRRLAGRGILRAYQASDFGPPILSDALAYFVCRQEQRVDHGTHSIFIGEVVAAHAAENAHSLVYVDGRYVSPSNPE